MQRFLAFLLLLGVCQAGLVHNRHGKENANLLQTDQIPVAIVLDKQDLKSSQLELEQQQQQLNLQTEAPTINLPSSDLKADMSALEEKLPQAPAQAELLPSTIAAAEIQTAKPTSQLNTELTPAAATIDEIKETSLAESLPAVTTADGKVQPSEDLNSLKALPAAAIIAADEPQAAVVNVDAVDGVAVVASSADDDLQRQATQATPTQTSTPQNFVQQLIQNSPIGQFLSQFAGQQQQQQQNQQADQPATPQPTLPGFLNPAAAITSAQQVVQNAAQSVVNSTTQAFQGLQQFATNLGTQFQNTFSNLAGQQNQLTTSDSTTTRPPGPIQQIVSNFIGGGNQNGTAAAAQAQQPQGPLQGLLGFFQGGNRPPLQGTTAPPKEVAAGVDDKIEVQPQNDPIVDKPQEPEEPDSVNEVRNSAEVTNINNDDGSFEVGPAEELIVVNDDAGAHDEVNAAVVDAQPVKPAIQQQEQQQQVEEQQSV